MDSLLALLLGALALPIALYAALVANRGARYRALAARLGATRGARGWLAPRSIVGPGFEIAAVRVGKGYRTRVVLALAECPGTFFLDARFFAHFPDWSHARVPATRKERAFLWELTLPHRVEPSPRQREELLRWLAVGERLRGVAARARELGVREIALGDGHLSTDFGGFVSDPDRLHATLELLRGLPREPAPAARARLGA